MPSHPLPPRVRSPIWLASLMLLCTTALGADLDTIRQTIDGGHYGEARREIQQLLEHSGDAALREDLQFEVERMRRIEAEFTLDRAALTTSIRRYLPDATEAEIARWDQAGLLESLRIDGQVRYFRKAAYNLMHIAPEIAARSPDYQRFAAEAALYRLHDHHREVLRSGTPPRRSFAIDYRLTVEPDAVPPGEIIRAWLPYPKHLPGQQEQVTFLGSEPAHHTLPDEEAVQHTIYLEQAAVAGQPTRFAVSYRYDSVARYTAINPSRVSAAPQTPELAPYLQERPPHIVFSDELRQLSARVVGLESDPYQVARKLFAHVDDIPWAGAREYSTIRNISAYAATAGHADCGQQTLLLMTLLRMNGIPSRWQSGWEFSPDGFDTMHDWGEFYLAPYGWLPMDVTHGRLDSDSDAEQWFYLGGLDAYRLVFNTDYSQPLVPAKQHLRSETVDSQRGEVEWRGGNLYFDQWDYDMQWRELDSE